MENKYTHGGLPSETAKHWCAETYQELGGILFHLLTGDTEKRRKAVCRYWELKRHFMKEEFEKYILILDTYRENIGNVPMTKLVDDATKEFAFGMRFEHIDFVCENKPTTKIETISLKEPDQNIISSLRGKEIVVEQLSLF